MYMHVNMYIYIYIYTHMSTHIYIYIYIYICTHTCQYIHNYIHLTTAGTYRHVRNSLKKNNKYISLRSLLLAPLAEGWRDPNQSYR